MSSTRQNYSQKICKFTKSAGEAVECSAKNSWLNLSKGSKTGFRYTNELAHSLRAYFKTDVYEDDLDQIIAFLHIHKPSSKPKFKEEDRIERVLAKTKFLKEQALLFVGAMGAAGAKIGGTISGPDGAAIGFVVGTATGILIITIVAGKILIKRIQKEDVPANMVLS